MEEFRKSGPLPTVFSRASYLMLTQMYKNCIWVSVLVRSLQRNQILSWLVCLLSRLVGKFNVFVNCLLWIRLKFPTMCKGDMFDCVCV